MPTTENLQLPELAAALGGPTELRRPGLEHIFLHDLLNTAAGLHVLARLFADNVLPAAQITECKALFADLTANLIDDIQHQRKLLQAERGDLELEIEPVQLRPFLQSVYRVCGSTIVGKNRHLLLTDPPDALLHTDAVLVRRSIVNLIKNAAEATPIGGTITLACQLTPGTVCFLVHNPGFMDDYVRQQIFLRPFTTKPGSDRGLGTYSVKLFVERYLNGRVQWTSSPSEGTVVSFQIPRIQ